VERVRTVLLTSEQRRGLCLWLDRVHKELDELAALKTRRGTNVDFAKLEEDYLACLARIETELAADCAERLR